MMMKQDKIDQHRRIAHRAQFQQLERGEQDQQRDADLASEQCVESDGDRQHAGDGDGEQEPARGQRRCRSR